MAAARTRKVIYSAEAFADAVEEFERRICHGHPVAEVSLVARES